MLNAAAEAILAHLSHCADHTTGSDRQPKAEPETAIMPTEMEDYLFDLRGYIVIENALDQAELNALNTCLLYTSPSPRDS